MTDSRKIIMKLVDHQLDNQHPLKKIRKGKEDKYNRIERKIGETFF